MDAAAATALSRKNGMDHSERGDADANAANTIREACEALKSKLENDFSTDDRFARGLGKYLAGRFDTALVWFGKGIGVASSRHYSNARNEPLVYARSVTLRQLGRYDDAIGVCDRVDRRYGTDNALREQVASALGTKGGTLGQFGRRAEAIVVFNEIDRRFGANEHPAVRAVVDQAREQKGRLHGDTHDDNAAPETD